MVERARALVAMGDWEQVGSCAGTGPAGQRHGNGGAAAARAMRAATCAYGVQRAPARASRPGPAPLARCAAAAACAAGARGLGPDLGGRAQERHGHGVEGCAATAAHTRPCGLIAAGLRPPAPAWPLLPAPVRTLLHASHLRLSSLPRRAPCSHAHAHAPVRCEGRHQDAAGAGGGRCRQRAASPAVALLPCQAPLPWAHAPLATPPAPPRSRLRALILPRPWPPAPAGPVQRDHDHRAAQRGAVLRNGAPLCAARWL